MSFYARIALLGAIVLAILGGIWKVHHAYTSALEREHAAGREEQRAENKAAADAQTERNRDLQRSAEKRYLVAAQAREEWFVATVKEVSHEAEPLAACPVPEPLRVRLNAASARFSGEDRPAPGRADDAVRGAGTAP